jgi:type II secretory pathway component GspD/PulD (secretin)
MIRTTSVKMGLLFCGLSLVAVPVARAADPPKPASDKAAEVDRSRLDVVRALEQFREAESRLRQAEKRLRDLEGKAAPAAEETPADTKVYALKFTDADHIAKVVGEAFGKGRIVIAVDPRTNSLVVRGQRIDLMEVDALLARLDQEGKPAPTVNDLGIYRLKSADAQAVAGVLSQLYGKGREARALIVVEPTTNALLVRAKDEDRKVIEDLIRYIDNESAKGSAPADEARPEFTIFPIEKADAVALAKVLISLFGQGRVQIVADPATNSLLVRGRPEDRSEIAKLIRTLDVPPVKPKKAD